MGAGEDLGAAVVLTAVLLGAVLGRVVADVAGYVEVEPSVGVVVAKRRRGGPSLAGDARGCGHIFEAAVAQTPVQDVRTVVRDEEIGPAVAVEIRGGESHAVPGIRRARRVARIHEVSRSLLQVEGVPRSSSPWTGRIRRMAALEQIDVEIPVAVGVEEPGSRAGDLGE